MLCERTDNEASGSWEALTVTIIKYNLKKNIKTTVNTAILKIKSKKYNHIFANFVRSSLERRDLKQEIDSASTTSDQLA